jgi:hypothetical protein
MSGMPGGIGSIGYFWFEKPAFTKRIFEEVKDLDLRGFRTIGDPLGYRV